MRRGADRVRNIADAEEMAYNEDRHRAVEREDQRRMAFAHQAGYRQASLLDPLIPYVCPTCACSVALSAVERHAEWHSGAIQ